MKPEFNDLRHLAARLVALQQQARALGIFAEDRELLECPGCGLLEDVDAVGRLLTCWPSSLGQDTSLRFEEVPGDQFRCPSCGGLVSEPCSARDERQD
jgi:hypothetical protein